MGAMEQAGRGEEGALAAPAIPEHRLVRCIGHGSYGRVWLAQSSLGAWRAVKVVRARESGRGRTYERELGAVQRFEPLSREHEGFADILQSGQGPDGRWFYYVMELADDDRTGRPFGGEEGGDGYLPRTLSGVLRARGRLSAREGIEMGVDLARGLRFLHRAGLLHRDIKPSNIVFVNGKAKLADIGLVVEQSRARSYVGTHGYIPPEGPNTPQADLYALGMVLYEAGMGMSVDQFPRPHPGIREDPDAALLRELNAVVLRACASRAGERYADAAALEDDLLLLASGGSVRRRRRRRTGFRVALAAAMGAGVVMVARWRGPQIAGWMGVDSGREPGPATAAMRSQAARSHVAQGTRLMESDDPAGAMVWFAGAMLLQDGDPGALHSHRVRLGHALDRIPRLRSTIHAGAGLKSVAIRPDGRQLAVADAGGQVSLWSLPDGVPLEGGRMGLGHPVQLAYTTRGDRLLAAPNATEPAVQGPMKAFGRAMTVDITSGVASVLPMEGIQWGVFSPDGCWLAAVRPGNEVWLHSVDGARPARRLAKHDRPISGLLFSPDNSLLVMRAHEDVARVWRVVDGAVACPDLPMGKPGRGLAFSPDSRLLAVASGTRDPGNSLLQAWSMPSGVAVTHPMWTEGVAFSISFLHGEGVPRLAGLLSDRVVVREMAGNGAMHSMDPSRATLRCWAIAQDGRSVVTGGDEGSVRVWNPRDGKSRQSFPMHARTVQWAGFSANGSCFFSASVEGLVRVWDAQPPAAAMQPMPLPGSVLPLGDARTPYPAAMDAAGRHLMLTRLLGGRPIPVAINLDAGVEEPLPAGSLELPCDRWIAGHRDSAWASWSLAGLREGEPARAVAWHRSEGGWAHVILPHLTPPKDVRFTPDDRCVVTWTADGTRRRWDARSGRLTEETRHPSLRGGAAALSHDGAMLASVQPSEPVLRILREGLGDAQIHEITLPAPANACHWLPGSQVVATEIPGRGTLHWRVDTGGLIPALTMAERLYMADWDAGSQRMLGLDGFGTSDVFAADGVASYRLMDESANSLSHLLAFSACKRFIVAVTKDQRLQVRDAASGQPVTRKIPLDGPARWVAMTRDGSLLVLGNAPMIQRWSLSPAMGTPHELLELAHLLSGRHLNAGGHIEWIDPAELAVLARRLGDTHASSARSSPSRPPR